MTPDLPLLFFWTCYLLWTVKQCNALSEWEEDPIARVYRPSPILLSQWILGGIILGTGILSKYTMGLAIVCSLLVLATQYRWRAWSRGFILHLVLAAIVASPILIHNLQNGFQPLRFQWEHATDPAHFSFSRAAEFIGVQTLMTGLLPFLMLPWLLIRFRKVVAHPTTRTLFFFFALPLLFFLYRTLRTYTEANWAFISYVAFWPLAQKITERTSFDREIRWLIAISFSVPIAVTCLLAIHLFSPLSIVRPQKDRIWRLTEQFALSKTVASDVNLLQLPVYCHNYQWTAYMRYQKVAASQLPATRPSHFTSPAESPCDHSSILVFTDGSAPEEPLRCFTGKTVIKDYSLSVRGETVGKYQLIQLVK
ncbi:MAG: hypothetical protein HY537_19110 [Deltaproteobacteria bacterium]|nr:hypothetical protein [Deltaproteobacteria bacterium]